MVARLHGLMGRPERAAEAGGLPIFIQTLLHSGVLGQGPVECLETHISWVLLCGAFAWKFKKPVSLGFLDFSTLEKRRHCCEEELRVNRRLAPDLYLAVVPFGGTPEVPLLLDDRDCQQAFEYAVKMRRFDQAALGDQMQREGRLDACHVDALARKMAGFHLEAAGVSEDSPWGQPTLLLKNALDNFQRAGRAALPAQELDRFCRLETWTRDVFLELAPLMAARRCSGFVRECHGDLHLGNIAFEKNGPVVFDAIEFNPAFRWTDVQSEIAFLMMDLIHHGRRDLAFRFLDGWLAVTGDHAGLRLLRWHLVYRAMVRAKVAWLRMNQSGQGPDVNSQDRADWLEHLKLADELAHDQAGCLLLTHGVSGSGKSWLALALAEELGGVRLRSDVERKRLAASRPRTLEEGGLYGAGMGKLTHEALLREAGLVCDAGFPAIVDAMFLDRLWRNEFRRLASTRHVPFLILSCQASLAMLRSRIVERGRIGEDPSDATLAVLETQLAGYRPLESDEMNWAMCCDTGIESLSGMVTRVKQWLKPAPAAPD